MSKSAEKMIELVRDGVGTAMPETVSGESVMQDESGYVFLRLAVSVHKDIITQAGYYASEEIPIDTAAAMASAAQLMKNRAIMSAALLGAKDIETALEFDGEARTENGQAVKIAEMMMKECLRNYSMKYNIARDERLKNRPKGDQSEGK